jgi:hypothetical protein
MKPFLKSPMLVCFLSFFFFATMCFLSFYTCVCACIVAVPGTQLCAFVQGDFIHMTLSMGYQFLPFVVLLNLIICYM